MWSMSLKKTHTCPYLAFAEITVSFPSELSNFFLLKLRFEAQNRQTAAVYFILKMLALRKQQQDHVLAYNTWFCRTITAGKRPDPVISPLQNQSSLARQLSSRAVTRPPSSLLLHLEATVCNSNVTHVVEMLSFFARHAQIWTSSWFSDVLKWQHIILMAALMLMLPKKKSNSVLKNCEMNTGSEIQIQSVVRRLYGTHWEPHYHIFHVWILKLRRGKEEKLLEGMTGEELKQFGKGRACVVENVYNCTNICSPCFSTVSETSSCCSLEMQQNSSQNYIN